MDCPQANIADVDLLFWARFARRDRNGHGSQSGRLSRVRGVNRMATILIIDDDHFFKELVSLHLLLAGHTVQAAKDPEEGLRAVVNAVPDLILLDLDLPYLSGFEVLEALRADPATRKVPVIMLTARRDEESYARCDKLGIDGFLTKPLQCETLIEEIAAVLAARAQA
jgi:DNA-binding response OmpR family regulator